jgi:hypothetical protein
MNVQLRNSNGYPGHVPIPLPRSPRRWKFGVGDTPGYTPAQQAMADAFKAQFGGGSSGPAVFQAPTVIPPPACSSDTQPGGAAFSSACIAELLAYQQQNMQSLNNANYAVDLENCLSTYPQPTDCYQRTFGLTPTGGFTSDAGAGPGGSTLILDANGNPVTNTPALLHAPVPTPAPTPTPTPTPQTQNTGGGSTAQKVADQLTGGGSTPTPTTPATSNTTLYWIAGLAAAGVLLFVAVNK